ncbi:FG-GAP-like repeat-containing protein [Streptomyces sp. NPDC015346]|uniref:FG-GAP repeat domain-containing protein n=1 Tax=Streptomyces sp. NPDC015346 TaxID=3364954 RepID=UPI0036F7E648
MHSKRARRIAACTALVLSAGMLLAATPASADEPAPRPPMKQSDRPFTPPAAPDLSELRSGTSGAARGAAADATSPVRFDVDGDGAGDLIYRAWDGLTYTTPSSGEGGEFLGSDGNTDLALDIVPIGDQDGNGQPEVLTLSPHGTLRLYANATATYGEHRWQGNGWTLYNKVFSPGDVNGDGRADLIGRQHNGDLYLYLANGSTWSSPFGARTKIGAGWNVYDQIVGIGDNDGDGKGDVIGRSLDGRLFFYGSTGSTSAPFKAPRQVGTGWGIFNQLIAVDDVNGDGAADLFARDQQTGTLWGYTGLGDGRLGPRVQIGATGGFQGVDQFGNAGSNPVSGKNAFMARDGAGTLWWYGSMNNGRLSPRDQVGEAGIWGGANLALASSLDSAGLPYLLETYEGTLYGPYGDYGSGWGIYNLLVGPGDLNGDGKGDLLARTSGGELYLYRGHGTGEGFASRIKIGSGWGAFNRIVGAGDYSGDGRTDILARDGAGDLYLYRGTGSAPAPFAARAKVGSGWNAYSKLVAPGDLNGDGKGDLLAVTSGGDLYRYYSTGTGAFGPRTKIGTGFQIYNGVY